jgi:hypothetical protein
MFVGFVYPHSGITSIFIYSQIYKLIIRRIIVVFSLI